MQIDRNNVLFLVRSTLMALHHANETGNYSVLREMSGPGFQSANNLARLTEIFANLRAQKVDLAPVSIFDPQITTAPSVDENNHLLIEGAYPQTRPGTTFRLLFVVVEGRWRLQGIAINVPQTAAAPAQQQAAPAPAQPGPAPAATAPVARSSDTTSPRTRTP